MKIFYCYGKNDFCDRDACFACEYYDGSDRKEIELTPEQEKAWQQLKKEEEAAAAWNAFIKPIKDILDKMLQEIAAFIDRIKKRKAARFMALVIEKLDEEAEKAQTEREQSDAVCPACGFAPICAQKSEDYNFGANKFYYRISCPRCGRKTSACESIEEAAQEWEKATEDAYKWQEAQE